MKEIPVLQLFILNLKSAWTEYRVYVSHGGILSSPI